MHVVRGTGRAPTALSAYDAALAAANVHDYNLVRLSSVLPPDATVEVVDVAPDVGPVGGRLHVVEAATTVAGTGPAAAALGWTRDEGGAGVVYEAADATGPEPVVERVRAGLEAARDLRGWTAAVEETVVASVPAGGAADVTVGGAGGRDATPRGPGGGRPREGEGADAPDRYTAAVALATFGGADPVV